jgi:outer membrane protein OmpA-like peptidoglycan-associated protein
MNRTVFPVTAILAIAVGAALSGCQSLQRPPALTLALTATSADPAAELGPLSSVVTEHAAAALLPGDGKIIVVTPDRTDSVDLTPMRGQDVESVQVKAEKLIASNITALDSLMSGAAATTDGLDVIGTLDRALERTPAGGRVIFVSSGYSTVAPLELNMAGDWINRPDDFVNSVSRANLPNAESKHITFAGLGYPNPASDQEQAGPAARTALTRIMLGLCAKMGAASCNTISGPVGQDPAVAANKVPRLILDQIATHCVGQTSIDTSIAFAPYSAELLPAADSILAPIAHALARCAGGFAINATGHSAVVPGKVVDTGLERDRAQAVLRHLVTLGAPEGVIGTAKAGGQLVDNVPGGTFHEFLAAKNRTVVLDIAG